MPNEEPNDRRDDTVALAAVLIVLVLIVFLFLLFKFNLFNGGTSIETRTTMARLPFLTGIVD
ncbi:MAG: hypothetical protein ACRDG4_06415 [Chloroflexota bacterium]